jgi:hypothetical protein
MTTGNAVLIVTHEVENYATWKGIYDNDKPNRDKARLIERFVVRDADKPNVVTVVFETPDTGTARAFASNPELKAAMVKAGVKAPSISIGNIAG